MTLDVEGESTPTAEFGYGPCVDGSGQRAPASRVARWLTGPLR
jgi:hypothetical protein